jgi:hypothetical protein
MSAAVLRFEKNHLKAIPLIGRDCSSNDLLNLT